MCVYTVAEVEVTATSFTCEQFLHKLAQQDHAPEGAKKRRSDVLVVQSESATKITTSKSERHKNGSEPDSRPAKRAKVCVIHANTLLLVVPT